MTNPFENRAPSLTGPATDILPVTPNDGADLPTVAVALYAETGGVISFVSVSGETRSVTVTDFAILPVGTQRVLSTGTTAFTHSRCPNAGVRIRHFNTCHGTAWPFALMVALVWCLSYVPVSDNVPA